MDRISTKRLPLKFFLIVYGLSIPIWIIERFVNIKGLPLDIPITDILAAFTPLIAACLLVHKEEGSFGVKNLLKRVFDFSRIKQKRWYLAIIFLPFLIYLLIYLVLHFMGLAYPKNCTFQFKQCPYFSFFSLLGQ